jgi:hypothetical protein
VERELKKTKMYFTGERWTGLYHCLLLGDTERQEGGAVEDVRGTVVIEEADREPDGSVARDAGSSSSREAELKRELELTMVRAADSSCC